MPDHTKPATTLSQRVSMKAKLRGVSRVSLPPRAGLDLAGDGSSSSEKAWLSAEERDSPQLPGTAVPGGARNSAVCTAGSPHVQR